MLDDYKVKNSKKCDCGYEFIINDINKLEKLSNSNMYGGNVKHVSKVCCPNCKKETILLLKQDGQTYKLIDIAQKEENTNSTLLEQIKNDIKYDNVNNNEFICPECKKTFKNNSGLKLHMKVHEKN